MSALLTAWKVPRRRTMGPVVLLALLIVGAPYVMLHRAGSDRFQRTIPLSGQFVSLLVDASAGRAFVVTATPPIWAGRVYTLDTSTGTLLDSTAVGQNAGPQDMFFDACTAHLFVLSRQEEVLRVLDARTGALLRTVTIGYMPDSQPGVVDSRTGRVFVWASGLRILDARSGAILRTLSDMGDMVAVDEQTARVFVADAIVRRVRMLDARTGSILRSLTLSQPPHAIVASTVTHHVFVLGDTVMWMLDARTGRVLRTIPVGRWLPAGWPPGLEGTMALLGNVVVIQYPGGGQVRLVDARTGRNSGAVPVGNVSGGPVVAGPNGPLYFVGTDRYWSTTGRLWMVAAATGAVLRTITIGPNPSSIAIDRHAGLILVTEGGDPARHEGSLRVLDARNGATLRTIAVGANPVAVGIDERLGRAVVVDAGGSVPVADGWGWLPAWLRRAIPFLSRPRNRAAVPSVTVLDVSR